MLNDFFYSWRDVLNLIFRSTVRVASLKKLQHNIKLFFKFFQTCTLDEYLRVTISESNWNYRILIAQTNILRTKLKPKLNYRNQWFFAVLGEEEGNFVKPRKIKCRRGPLMHEWRLLSDDLIKVCNCWGSSCVWDGFKAVAPLFAS